MFELFFYVKLFVCRHYDIMMNRLNISTGNRTLDSILTRDSFVPRNDGCVKFIRFLKLGRCDSF